MKLCWDNIENLYLTKNKGYLKNKITGAKFVIKESCGYCGNAFLAQPQSNGTYCSHECKGNYLKESYERPPTKKNTKLRKILLGDE